MIHLYVIATNCPLVFVAKMFYYFQKEVLLFICHHAPLHTDLKHCLYKLSTLHLQIFVFLPSSRKRYVHK